MYAVIAGKKCRDDLVKLEGEFFFVSKDEKDVLIVEIELIFNQKIRKINLMFFFSRERDVNIGEYEWE